MIFRSMKGRRGCPLEFPPPHATLVAFFSWFMSLAYIMSAAAVAADWQSSPEAARMSRRLEAKPRFSTKMAGKHEMRARNKRQNAPDVIATSTGHSSSRKNGRGGRDHTRIPQSLLLMDTRGPPPLEITQRWNQILPQFQRFTFWSNRVAESWLSNHYDRTHVTFYNDIALGRYKADFFKLCFLYRMGGWFSDVDMEPTQEMSKLSLVGVSFFTSVIMVAGKPNGNVQNTFIATVPGHPMLRKAIHKMMEVGPRVGINPPDAAPYYGLPTRCLGQIIMDEICAYPRAGLWSGANGAVLLAREEVTPEDEVSRGPYYGAAIWLNRTRLAYTRYRTYSRNGFSQVGGRRLSSGGNCTHSCQEACVDVPFTKKACASVTCGIKCARTCCELFGGATLRRCSRNA